MMHFVRIENRRYAQFPRLRDEPGLVHAFSTRPLNVYSGDGRTGDHRQLMARDWDLDPQQLHYCRQVHGTRLVVINADRPGGVLDGCDGVATDLPGVGLMTFSADCPLVLIYDPVGRAVGMVHASWRCTVAQNTRRLVELLANRFGSRPEHMRAGIGPGAGPERYEVGSDVYEAAAGLAERDRFFLRRDDRMYFDLWAANRAQLCAAGVPADRVEVAGICTMTRTDLFFSYRREGRGCGHFGLLAALVPPAPDSG